jgi:phage terminase large subunit-like protein
LINAMMSAVTDEDKWDNRWLAKQRSVNKIDAAVALCMGVGAAAVSIKTKEFQLFVF